MIAPFFELENKRLVKLANFISYVTENKLQKDYPSKSNAVTIGLSDVVIKNVLKANELDRVRFFSDKIKIGLIGGFDAKYKGQDVLIKAINSLDIEVKNKIELFFVGKGESVWVLNMVKDLKLSENVKFVGPLKSGDEVNNFLKTLSLYIQPSLTEGMPRAIIEAMSMGCPVIGSNVGGIPDVVDEKYIHSKGDYKELSIHIKELFFDRERLYKESKMSLSKAEPYLYENLYNKRVNFYNKMNQIKK
ncbi:glycosyltransferase family 4 protein [Chryseobacterium sp. POE27]|uniref:glycosyltransferase family 4 protein n=1 Tax=Chryseobacterium sp. POE27 TaxID=3138177 RepID=UPI00321901A4